MSVQVFLEEVGIWLNRLSEGIHSHQSWWIIQPTGGPKRTKIWKKGDFSLYICHFLSNWEMHILLPFDLGALGSQAFRLWTFYQQAPGLQAFGLSYNTSFPDSPACRWQTMGLLYLCYYMWANLHLKKTLIHISVYPIGSVSWEHRMIQQSLLKITEKQLAL